MNQLKVGDVVWLARTAPRRMTDTCPVCNGDREVTVRLGDGSEVRVACGYCAAGFDGSRGFVEEYEHTPAAVRDVIRTVQVEDDVLERRVRYVTWENGHVGPDDVFPDETAAAAKAAILAKQEADREDDMRRHRKDGAMRSMTWNIGYHLREAKKARAEAERHEARAVVLRQRNKDGAA